MEESQILCIAFASYIPMNGVIIECQLKHSKQICGLVLENYFKLTFGNVCTDSIDTTKTKNSDSKGIIPMTYVNNIKTCFFEIISEDLILISSNKRLSNESNKYYGLSFFIKRSNTVFSAERISLLCFECAIATAQLCSLYDSKKSWIHFSTEIAIETSKRMMSIMNSFISAPLPIYSVKSNEISFFSAILSSHIQTQMTTIIEADEEDSKPIFNFLSHFLLPYQFALSSSQVHKDPIRGLYLQCVEKKNTLPVDKLFAFDRPWTWIRVKDRIVFQSPSISTQASISKEYIHVVQMNYALSDEEKSASISKFRKIYKSDITKHLAEAWTTKFLDEFCEANQLVQPFICQNFMRNIHMNGILMIELIDHYLNTLDRYFLRKSEAAEIAQSLGVTDKDELKAITAVAQLNEQRTFRRMQKAKEVLNKLVATV